MPTSSGFCQAIEPQFKLMFNNILVDKDMRNPVYFGHMLTPRAASPGILEGRDTLPPPLPPRARPWRCSSLSSFNLDDVSAGRGALCVAPAVAVAVHGAGDL